MRSFLIIGLIFTVLPVSVVWSADNKNRLEIVLTAPPEDTLNSEYLKGEAERFKSNATTLQTKTKELVLMYKGIMDKYRNCDGVYDEAKRAWKLSSDGLKLAEKILRTAEAVLKEKKMKKAKRMIKTMEEDLKQGIFYRTQAEEREKEVKFEMKGC